MTERKVDMSKPAGDDLLARTQELGLERERERLEELEHECDCECGETQYCSFEDEV